MHRGNRCRPACADPPSVRGCSCRASLLPLRALTATVAGAPAATAGALIAAIRSHRRVVARRAVAASWLVPDAAVSIRDLDHGLSISIPVPVAATRLVLRPRAVALPVLGTPVAFRSARLARRRFCFGCRCRQPAEQPLPKRRSLRLRRASAASPAEPAPASGGAASVRASPAAPSIRQLPRPSPGAESPRRPRSDRALDRRACSSWLRSPAARPRRRARAAASNSASRDPDCRSE